MVGRIETWVKRCVGMPGDTIKMKNGILFVNGENVDKNYTLDNEFVIKTGNPKKFIDALHLTDNQNAFLVGDPITLSSNQYKIAISLIIVGQDSIMQKLIPSLPAV